MLAGAYTPATIPSQGHVPSPLITCQAGSNLLHIYLHPTRRPTSTASPTHTGALHCIVQRRLHRTMVTLDSATPISTTSINNRHILNTCHSRTSTLLSSNINPNSNNTSINNSISSSKHHRRRSNNTHNNTMSHLPMSPPPVFNMWCLLIRSKHQSRMRSLKLSSTLRLHLRSNRVTQPHINKLLQIRMRSCKQFLRANRMVASLRSISPPSSRQQTLSD